MFFPPSLKKLNIFVSVVSGADLYDFLEGLSERVVVIISADLAHTHLKDGPYGYSNASEPFDQVRTLVGLRSILVSEPLSIFS